jgi:hypothetical protein
MREEKREKREATLSPLPSSLSLLPIGVPPIAKNEIII